MRLVLHPRCWRSASAASAGSRPTSSPSSPRARLPRSGLARAAIACVVSLELKADEPAIHRLAGRLGVPARFFAAATLEAEAPRLANPSTLVYAATGCHGVAEGAALAAVGPDGALLVEKVKSARATLAIGRAPRPLDPLRIGRPQGRLA